MDVRICWYCHWGWPKVVADIYDKALLALGGNESPLHYGPAHIVWEDENFQSAEWCLEHFDENWKDGKYFNAQELSIVKQSLEELAAIPVESRCVEPDNYDGEHPELYPPPDGIEMVQR